VSSYLSEDEQVEALKKWWKENGKAIIGGAVLGLGLVGGWQAWKQHNQGQAELASAYYEEFMLAAKSGDKSALNQGERLLEKHGGSTYAQYAALELAAMYYKDGDHDKARERLQWVLDTASEPALKEVARLRLARLLLDAGQLDQAAGLVADTTDDSFAGEFAELRGDIALARGDKDKARAAYQEALLKDSGDAELIRMKLAEIGGADAS